MRISTVFGLFSQISAVLLLASVISAGETTRKIVIFKNSVNETAKVAALENLGAKAVKIRNIPFINAVVVDLPQDAATTLSANAGVDFIENDSYENWLETVGGDNLAEFEVSRPETGESQVLPWGVNRIDAEKAWRKTSGKQIKVAVVDTGSGPHPDLKIWGGASMVAYTDSYNDDHFHGTHVAGIVAAMNNEFGVIGVAPRARLYAVKVLNGGGSGYLSDVVSGLEWCINNKMDVINMSLGTWTNYKACRLAVEAVYKANIVIAAAAGNNYGGEVIYPAAYPQCLAISATDQSNGIAYFSSTGPEIDFSAPGQNVLSSIRWNRMPGYGKLSGTSMAAPHVAGTVALIISMPDPDNDGIWTIPEVREKLKKTSSDLGYEERDDVFGYGLVNALLAVK